ncbi:MAG: Do family serine endopeptidase, partial [Pyrinomonadaceae bacterium]
IASTAIFSGCSYLRGNDVPVTAQPAAAPEPVVVNGIRTSYADIVDKTSPAVVRIEADHKTKGGSQVQAPNDMFHQLMPQMQQRPQIERGLGSGVVVNADGTILTNYHVVEDADKITVSMGDNKSYQAKVLGTDQPSDLALLKIDASNLPYLTLGDSDRVRVGDIVLAIGNPLGIGQTVTAGIISAKGRRTGLSDGSYEDFLQTDAPINRGNSGGALVNLEGELIGINSQILSGGPSGGSIGIGFSIPSNMAKSVMDQLLKDGKVHRGMLGVGIQNLTDDLSEGFHFKGTGGVLINDVKSGSAAEKAGLKRDDIITAFNGEKIEDTNSLRNKVAQTSPGTSVKVTISRDGKESDINVTLDEFKASDSQNPAGGKGGDNGGNSQDESGKLGLTLEPLNGRTAKQLGLDASNGGLVVTEVDPTGPAAEAGIAEGDVILEINRKAVSSVADAKSAIDASGGRPVLLLMSRKGQTIYVTVKPE